MSCVHLEVDITPYHAAITSLGIETHPWTDVAHLKLTKPLEESDFTQFEPNKKLLESLQSAKYDFTKAQTYDENLASKQLGDWKESASVHSKLTDLVAEYIREKLEKRSAETSRKKAEYGMGKLVEKVAEGYMTRKANKLATRQPTDEDDAAQHQERVKKVMGDKEVDKLVTKQIVDAESSDIASVAHAKALAEAQGICIVIHNENGEQVLNASASGERVHLDASKSDDKKVRQLVPRANDSQVSSEAFTYDSSGRDGLYRSVFFATNGCNATEADVASQKSQVAAKFAESPSLKVFLYANQKPRRIYGAADRKRTA